MHIPELTAVALIKDDNHLLVINGVRLIFFDKGGQLLDGGDDNV
jgi:hypothetical protein